MSNRLVWVSKLEGVEFSFVFGFSLVGIYQVVTFNEHGAKVTRQDPSFSTLEKLAVSHVAASILVGKQQL